MNILNYVTDLIYGNVVVVDEIMSPYDRCCGSCITKDKEESKGLDIFVTEDDMHYAAPYSAYDHHKDLSHFSDIYPYENRFFRYNYTDAIVEMLSIATQEEIIEDSEWQEKYNRSLFDLVNIDGIVYMKINSIGLSKDHWNEEDCRKEYLSGWVIDYFEECKSLERDFIKYELPHINEEEN